MALDPSVSPPPCSAWPDMPTRPVVLSALEVPDALSGRWGTNRAGPARLQLNADTDIGAIQCFLAEYDASPGTYRIYQRECERLVLWALFECQKPLSSLTRQDFEGYLNFLADPQPAQFWCGPRAPRESESWRPFVGPLSEAAVLTAMAAIGSLMKYLTDAGYLAGNPLGLLRQKRHKLRSSTPDAQDPAAGSSVERFLDEDMWRAVSEAVEALADQSDEQRAHKERLRFVFACLYMLAPRAGELESHRMGSFRQTRGRWWWHVTGKGRKSAQVPVPDDMMAALVRYRKSLGLSPLPSPEDQTPMLVSIKDGRPITARRLNQVLKALFQDAADKLPEHLSHKREKLLKASAHWGRHTSVTAKIDSGMDPRYVQKDARHEDFSTTTLYLHEEETRRHEEAQKQRLAWAQSKGT